MLVALLPNQVSEHWNLFKKDIEDSLPPIADWGPYDLNSIMYSMMIGMMMCWLVVDKEQKTKGFITTVILKDVSGIRTLLVYNAIAIENTSLTDWTDCYDTLKTYAVNKGCSKIGAFIKNERILAILGKDADVETRFIFAHKNL